MSGAIGWQALLSMGGSGLRLGISVRTQGWEFAHFFSERIARFLLKSERMSDSLKKLRDSLSLSFLVSNLSNLLMLAQFL